MFLIDGNWPNLTWARIKEMAKPSFLVLVWALIVSIKLSAVAFYPTPLFKPEFYSTTENVPTETSSTSLFVQTYAAAPPLSSTVCNKYLVLPGLGSFLSVSPALLTAASLCPCLCLFFTSLPSQSGQSSEQCWTQHQGFIREQ